VSEELNRYKFRKNLRLLNDVLATTPFRDKYFVMYGLLLGWARERRIIPHDYFDADFGFFSEDRNAYLDTIDLLARAGFILTTLLIGNSDDCMVFVFTKDGAKFEFYDMFRNGDYSYAFWYGHGPDEIVSEVPLGKLVPMRFLDRTWLKPDDHESFLAASYGDDWRIPDKNYRYWCDDKSIIAKYPCRHRNPVEQTRLFHHFTQKLPSENIPAD
jgi:hypothetical protein